MGFSAGTKIGPYEVVGQLGAGGMGEVYRAHDTRLGRDVALKVLPSHLSGDAELRQRFDREARAIAALDHPNICGIYDIGNHEDTEFLVLEFIEGESLAQRIARGPLHLNELLKIGAEVSEGLERAHRAGIVHRDLKPGNIMLSKDGAKLLDFGLAKPAAFGAAAGSGTAPLLSAAVTMTSPVSPLTTRGMIVGTIQYMAPEQIEGKPADARSDIFAFGAVLYEMATGKRAFEGKSQISVASAILEKEPEPISAVQPAAPLALDYCIRTCLSKNPDDRFQTAHDVGLQLKWVATSSRAAMAALPKKPATRRRLIFATVGTIGLILAALAGFWLNNGSGNSRVIRAEIAAPDKVTWDFTGDFGGPPVISPDGTKIVFAAHTPDSPRQLWVRRTDSFTSQRLDGTSGASFPFWSADGRFIGFFAEGKMKKIAFAGGAASVLADAGNPRGATWNSDNEIVFAPDFQGALMRVSGNGGKPVPVTKLDIAKHTTHRWPWFMPDGKHFIYLASSHNGGNPADNGIYFASLDGSQSKLVLPTDGAAQYANGYLLYHAQSSLVAQTFNPRTGELSGDAIPLIDKVMHDSGIWRTTATVSQNGVLLYQASSTELLGTQLVWHDLTGKNMTPLTERGSFVDPRISPDGKHVAVSLGDPSRQVWVIDAERGSRQRLTFDDSIKNAPSWSPDGKMLVYQVSSPSGHVGSSVWVKAVNGAGAAQKVVDTPSQAVNYPAFSGDGKYIAYLSEEGPTGASIVAVPLEGDRKPFVVVTPPTSQASIQGFTLSPDGRWIAYVSTESGRQNVYITTFPHSTGKWQASTDMGDFPAWRSDSKKLYFIRYSDDLIYECDIEASGDDLQIGPPKPLLKAAVSALGRGFDVTPDGKRFLVDEAQQDTSNPLSLIVNWPAELKKK